MTTTTMNPTAALRALADHIDRYQLPEGDIDGIRFDDETISAQVHMPHTVAAWVRSLDDVQAAGHLTEGDAVHLYITGHRNDFTVRIIFVLRCGRFDDLHQALTAQKLGGNPYDFEPIELPEILGGAA